MSATEYDASVESYGGGWYWTLSPVTGDRIRTEWTGWTWTRRGAERAIARRVKRARTVATKHTWRIG